MERALVVGGNSGIGAAVAEALDKDHFLDVICPDTSVLDVRRESQIHEFIRDMGPFPYIVYSAGINELRWLSDIDQEFMDDILRVNVTGLITLVGYHARYWPGTDMSIVAVSSDAARIPMRASVAYCVSKAGLDMAVRTMARELAPRHRVNAVAPGMVEGTAMTDYIDRAVPHIRGWTAQHAREYERQGTPTGRRASRSEVAETIAWVLTGPEQMTGAIIEINGGR